VRVDKEKERETKRKKQNKPKSDIFAIS